MGAAYAAVGLGLKNPRVGLLNVGTEEHKGRAELKEAHDRLVAFQHQGDFEYVGFVEGSDIPSDRVDVIVTDGFTGNIALKTAEGTARQIAEYLRSAMSRTWMAKLGYILAKGAFDRLREKMDPRKVNGGVFGIENGAQVLSLQFRGCTTGFNLHLHARIGFGVLLKQLGLQVGPLVGSNKNP